MNNHYMNQEGGGYVGNIFPAKDTQTKVWLLALIISLLLSFSAGLFLIWMSINRTDLAYEIHKIQKDFSNGQGHIVKLEVERDSLLSPYELDKKAQNLGLSIADPGQVRRLTD